MFNTRSERIVTGIGNLFLLAAIVFFVTLVLLASGTVQAQEFQLTDSMEPDALDGDALEEDALGEDALGLERVDPALIRQLAAQKTDLPIAEIPPRPRQAIPMWFCWRCWAWHTGFGPPRIRPNHCPSHESVVAPAVTGDGQCPRPEIPRKKAKEGETK